jgi:molecular chaperone GrpE
MANRETVDEKKDSDGSSAGAAANPEPAPTAPELAPATADEGIAALMAERDEARDRMLRIAADCDNGMKRARKEQADAVHQARADVLRDMLEVVDDLERALDTQAALGEAADETAVRKGVELVLRSLLHKLERHGVEPVAAAGQPFDPHVHDAISRVDCEDVPPGTVAAELRRGYRFGNRLLRPAGVAVSTGQAPEHAPTAAQHATE